jgi:RND superfamily putative drug exporter
MLVTFDVAGDSNQAQANVVGPLAATAATAADHPQLRAEVFGSASANKALIKAYDGDFTRAEHTSLPITLRIAFGSQVAAGVPLLLGFTGPALFSTWAYSHDSSRMAVSIDCS